MSENKEEKQKAVLKHLKRKRVFTLEQLVSYLECSVPTARLRLKKWKTYTSYNQNGRYYSLKTVPRFDENGLWHYEHVFFSKSGNLKKTLVYLVQKSPSGLTGKEIGDLVGLPPRSFLHHFRNTAGIFREKMEGLYIYFSDDPGRYKRQSGNRSNLIVYQDELFSDADAVIILTALIRHHGISLEEIMALPEIRAQKFSSFVINDFLSRHDLLKKTLDIQP
ncbi:MAG: hypothetical protein HQ517_13415 [SAR324 cluster bacterium]|nr:hypothetical protein [SAR324 cluster bacterium]